MIEADERWHGTRHGYDEQRCRCDACRACNADRVARWRGARRRGEAQPHPWRELVVGVWSEATSIWLTEREAVGNGWATETREYEESSPAPQFKDILVTMAYISC